ncbi:MFS transporter [Streptomyces tibetensis]|uniref:MFS transporter n=1 Tax=Streptomyces tibetensis TaxID=2382123 RepID=UPI003410CE37
MGRLAGLRADYAVLRNGAFRRIVAARALTQLGTAASPVAVAFAVLQHHSASALGLVLSVQSAGFILLCLVGGVTSDKLPRAKLMVVTETCRGLSQLLLGVLILWGHAPLWAFMVLATVNGAGSAFSAPTRQGMVAEHVEEGRRQAANGLLNACQNGATAVGAAAAGLAAAFFGPGWVVVADGLSFFGSALLLAGLIGTAPVRMRTQGLGVRNALGMVRGTPWLRSSLVFFMAFQLCYYSVLFVLGPAAMRGGHDAAAQWGVVVAAFSAGLFSGALVAVHIRPRRPLAVMFLLTLSVVPGLLCLAWAPGPLLLVVAQFCAGLGLSCADTLWMTVLQDHVPQEIFGKVVSVDWLFSAGLRPLGYAGVGFLAAVVPPAVVFAGAAAALAASVLAAVLRNRDLSLAPLSPEPVGGAAP